MPRRSPAAVAAACERTSRTHRCAYVHPTGERCTALVAVTLRAARHLSGVRAVNARCKDHR